MEALHIAESEFTPRVMMDPEKHIFELEGVSRPEDVMGFYNPILKWLINYDDEILSHSDAKYNINDIRFIVKLSYFNSASSKSLLQILEVFQRIYLKGFPVNIDFFYDEGDDQMREDGEDLADAVDMRFNFLPLPS
ncbi:MAG: DUF1987 domain-containing protein [Bacteroidales bacterium]|nr:DUF1987 domain-containing protein [Bacteroidales bacterium]